MPGLALGLGLGLTMQRGGATDALIKLFGPDVTGVLIDRLAKQAYTDTDLTILVSSDGQAVAGLKDRSGGGNNGTQATAASQATFKTGSPPYLSFDGGDSYAFPNDVGKFTGDFAVYHVVTVPSSGTQEIITKSDTSSSSGNPKCWTLDFASRAPRFLFRSVENSNTPGSGYGLITGSALTAGSTHVIGVERSGSTIKLRVDGVEVGTALTGVTGTLGDFNAEMQVGRLWVSGAFSLYFTGKFYRALLLNGASLTDDNRPMVVSSLGAGLL